MLQALIGTPFSVKSRFLVDGDPAPLAHDNILEVGLFSEVFVPKVSSILNHFLIFGIPNCPSQNLVVNFKQLVPTIV